MSVEELEKAGDKAIEEATEEEEEEEEEEFEELYEEVAGEYVHPDGTIYLHPNKTYSTRNDAGKTTSGTYTISGTSITFHQTDPEDFSDTQTIENGVITNSYGEFVKINN